MKVRHAFNSPFGIHSSSGCTWKLQEGGGDVGNLTTGAVQGLGHIETILGIKLFERDGTATPTALGEIVVAHSSSIITDYAEMLRELRLAEGLDLGSITVSSGLYAAEVSVQEAVAVLSEKHPNIFCELVIKDWTGIVEDVLSRRSDLGIADLNRTEKNPHLETELIRDSSLSFFCRSGHPLAKRKNLQIADLLHYPWAGPSLPDRMRAFLPEDRMPWGEFNIGANRVIPRIRVETVSAAKYIVAKSDAISAAPQLVLRAAIRSGTIVVLPVQPPWFKMSYGFIWSKGRSLSPSCRAFMEIVRDLEKKLGR